MRLTQLRYVEAAIRLGSIRAAADELAMSQPSLSEQIRRLEEELGVVLLVRGRRGVTPTAAGESILPAVQGMLAGETAIRQEANAIAGLATGLTRIGAISVVARSIIPDVLARLMRGHPGLRFQIYEGGSLNIERDVLRGDLDLGIVAQLPGRRAYHDGLTATPLLTTPILVGAPRGHPLAGHDVVTAEQLARHPLVTFPRGFVLRQVLDDHYAGREMPLVVQAGSIETLRVMVSAGMGVALETELGTFLPTSREDRIQYSRYAGPPTGVEIVLLYRAGSQPSQSALAVIQNVRAKAKRWAQRSSSHPPA